MIINKKQRSYLTIKRDIELLGVSNFFSNSPIFENSEIKSILYYDGTISNINENPKSNAAVNFDLNPNIKSTAECNTNTKLNTHLSQQKNPNKNQNSNSNQNLNLEANSGPDKKSYTISNKESTSEANKSQEKDPLILCFVRLCDHFKQYVKKNTLKSVFLKFIQKHDPSTALTLKSETKIINEKVVSLVGISQYYFFELFKLFIDELLDPTFISKVFQENIFTRNQNFKIDGVNNNCGDPNANYDTYSDVKCKFYQLKQYKSSIEDIINKEFDILKRKFNNKSGEGLNKGIIYSDDKINTPENQRILIPLYPNLTLNHFISFKHNLHDDFDPISTSKTKTKTNLDRKKNLYLTTNDKLVIMLEIANALKNLHLNGISHNNLSDASIFIDSNRDAYIGNFYCDINLEDHLTNMAHVNYYRHPSLIKYTNNFDHDKDDVYEEKSNEDEAFDEKDKKYDIYSFALLVYQIVSETEPKYLFKRENATREKIIKTLKKTDDYIEFLFKDYDKIDFDKFCKIDGIRQFIIECMKNDAEYTDFDAIISKIHEFISQLPKEEEEEEVKYRCQHANNSETYKCTLNDIIFNYYFNCNENSKKMLIIIINQAISMVTGNKVNDLFENEDIITTILKFISTLNIGFGNDQIFLNECFNEIIRRNVFSKLNREQFNLNDYEQKLMELSKNMNINVQKEEDYDYDYEYEEDKKKDIKEDIEMNKYLYKEPIIEDISNVFPITTLDKFEEFSKIYPNSGYDNYLDEMTLLYIYNICKEIQIIHSHGLYHGEIKEESIGIYYDSKEKIFIPSILLYYYYYQTRKSKTQKKRKERDIDIDIEHKQNKDILNLIKLIKKHVSNTNLRIERIYEQGGIDYIVMYLYDFIQNHYNNDNYSPILYRIEQLNDYSKYQLTFRILADIYLKYKVSEDISNIFLKYQESNDKHNEPFLNIEDTFKEILNFSNEIFDVSNSTKKDETMEQILQKIKNNNDEFFKEYYSQSSATTDETITEHKQPKFDKDVIKMKGKMKVIDHYAFKMRESFDRNERMSHKEVYRKLEMVCLNDREINFLLLRYIKTLYPKSNFRIKLIIQNKDPYDYNKIIELMKRYNHTAEFENGDFFIHVDNIGPPRKYEDFIKNKKK